MPFSLHQARRIALVSLASVLTACGGGGGGGGGGEEAPPVPAPAAPVLTLTPQAIKTFRFSWSDVTGETRYALLENPDGTSGFTEVASIAANATQHDLIVPLPLRVNARYILQACNAGGCTSSAEVSVTGSLTHLVGYVKASNTGTSDVFGYSVAVSGDGRTLAVGAMFERSAATGIDGDQADDSLLEAGAAFVFARDDAGLWAQQAYVKASDTSASARFGSRVALSNDGNTLAVAAYTEGSPAVAGAVYLFDRTANVWSQVTKIKAPFPRGADHFGIGLALSGDGSTLGVGLPGDDHSSTNLGTKVPAGTGTTDSGAAIIYVRTAGVWTLEQTFKGGADITAARRFGQSVALSQDGNVFAIGAPEEDSSATNSGTVYVFGRSNGVWSLVAERKALNAEAEDRFGSAVALSHDGSTLAVAATGESSQVASNPDDNSAVNSGAVYVFSNSGGTWPQQGYLKADVIGAGDAFGSALAMSNDGNTLLITAMQEASSATGIGGNASDDTFAGSGAAYVFKRAGTAWSQRAYVKATNTGTVAANLFGSSAAMSSDASVIAIGASSEDGNSTGVGGDQTNAPDVGNVGDDSGAVYLY